MDDIFPYNAGIMLMNMPYLRQTNKQFIDWILEQRNGLYFDGEPPAWFNRVDCLLGSSDSHKLILLNNWSLWLFWHRVRSTGPGCHQPILREGDQGQAHQQGMARPPARSPARPPALLMINAYAAWMQDFNAKPYQPFRASARIVHLHGCASRCALIAVTGATIMESIWYHLIFTCLCPTPCPPSFLHH